MHYAWNSLYAEQHDERNRHSVRSGSKKYSNLGKVTHCIHIHVDPLSHFHCRISRLFSRNQFLIRSTVQPQHNSCGESPTVHALCAISQSTCSVHSSIKSVTQSKKTIANRFLDSWMNITSAFNSQYGTLPAPTPEHSAPQDRFHIDIQTVVRPPLHRVSLAESLLICDKRCRFVTMAPRVPFKL